MRHRQILCAIVDGPRAGGAVLLAMTLRDERFR